MFIDADGRPAALRQEGHVYRRGRTAVAALRQEGHVYRRGRTAVAALRQEGHVYRSRRRQQPPSVRRVMYLFIREELEKIFGFICNVELL